MRSRPFKVDLRERLFDKRHSIHTTRKLRPRRIARLWEGRLLIGTASEHRTPEARKWRTQLRLIRQRSTAGEWKQVSANDQQSIAA